MSLQKKKINKKSHTLRDLSSGMPRNRDQQRTKNMRYLEVKVKLTLNSRAVN